MKYGVSALLVKAEIPVSAVAAIPFSHLLVKICIQNKFGKKFP